LRVAVWTGDARDTKPFPDLGPVMPMNKRRFSIE
jgi:hypothetical protein